MQVARSPLLMKRAPEILQYKWAKKKNTWQKTGVKQYKFSPSFNTDVA